MVHFKEFSIGKRSRHAIVDDETQDAKSGSHFAICRPFERFTKDRRPTLRARDLPTQMSSALRDRSTGDVIGQVLQSVAFGSVASSSSFPLLTEKVKLNVAKWSGSSMKDSESGSYVKILGGRGGQKGA